MPEYLSPGVFIEEIPARLKAIEGVSTSTAGFVGPAERGPVAGFPFPFVPTKDFPLPVDPAPVLVTSQSQFIRTFGNALPLPTASDDKDAGYLAYAVKAFFDNGGKRCYISRVVKQPGNPVETRALLAQAQLSQGVVIRLAKPAKAGDQTLFVTSLRGVKKGDSLKLFKVSDGSSAINGGKAIVPLLPSPQAAPFQLAIGDAFAVKVGTDVSVPSNPIAVTAATIEGAAGPIDLVVKDTLSIRVGGRVQTIEFAAIAAGSVEQLSAILNEQLREIQAFVSSAGKLTIRSDQLGSGAEIEVIGGIAADKLGLKDAAGNFKSAKGEGNVSDIDRVSINEIRSLFSPSPTTFEIQDDGMKHIQIISVAAGADVKIQVEDTVAGTLKKLGLSNTVGSGTAPTEFTIESYDTARNSVRLNNKLLKDLEPDNVFGIFETSGSLKAEGPRFYARNPGVWGASLVVSFSNTERSLIPVLLPATGDKVQVQPTSGFYVGAIVEIDYGRGQGYTRTANEITAIDGNVLTLMSPLAHPVEPGVLVPAPDAANPQSLPQGSFIQVLEIDVTISDNSGASPTESFKGLSWNLTNPRRHYANQINAGSRLVYVQPPGVGGLSGSEAATLDNQPVTANGFPMRLFPPTDRTSGLPDADETGDAVYIGRDEGPGKRTGIQALKDLDDIRIIAAPGKATASVQNELITQCSLLRYRFAVLDSERPNKDGSVTSILNHRSLYDSSFAAYYSPWVAVQNGNSIDYLPPSGYVAGIYARTDNERGVHKAPANEVVRNATGLQSYFTTGEQDILNPRGVNAIRRFDGRGIRVWGARTLSSDPEFRYVNVRRFMIFLEASIDRGTQYVVFEPNSPETWSRVVDSISAFLNTQWRNGALFGRRADDAYYVRCDESTMTVDDIQNGRLICDIGVAIVRPAEFVIFRIEQITGFANKS